MIKAYYLRERTVELFEQYRKHFSSFKSEGRIDDINIANVWNNFNQAREDIKVVLEYIAKLEGVSDSTWQSFISGAIDCDGENFISRYKKQDNTFNITYYDKTGKVIEPITK